MTGRVDIWELEHPFNRMMERFKQAQTGQHRSDVDDAMRQLIEQIEFADKAIEVAELQHAVDQANEKRVKAEERLRELWSI